MADRARCRSENCGREILWATTLHGHVPLDPDPVAVPAPGMVALHVPSGRGFALQADDFDLNGALMGEWKGRVGDDVEVHLRHHATCPAVREFDVNPNQEKLL